MKHSQKNNMKLSILLVLFGVSLVLAKDITFGGTKVIFGRLRHCKEGKPCKRDNDCGFKNHLGMVSGTCEKEYLRVWPDQSLTVERTSEQIPGTKIVRKKK